MNDLGFISTSALQQYVVSAEALSVNTAPLLEQSKIDAAILSDAEGRIPGTQFETFLKLLIEESRNPLFGLATAKHVQPGSYNIMGYIAMSSSTLGEAISKTPIYEKLVGDMGTTEMIPWQQQIDVIWKCRYPNEPVRRHLIENVLGSWVNYARWLANVAANPNCVKFDYPKPDDISLSEYEEAFQSEVLFDQDYCAITINPDILTLPLRQPDPSIVTVLEEHAVQKLSNIGLDTTTRFKVREVIKSLLKTGTPRKEKVAEVLNMNARTMHRRLQEESTSYQSELDELRKELACDLLKSTNLPQAEIATQLGFFELRSFQRSFKQWTGITPGDYRKTPS